MADGSQVAAADVEHVDMNIGGDGSGTDWGKMTEAQQTADVSKLVAEVAKRREPDPADAEPVPAAAVSEPEAKTEAKTKTKTPAAGDETPADDDTVPAEPKDSGGEGEEEGAEEADWLDPDTRDFATTMGLTDEDLGEFGSRDELDRVLRIIGRKAFEAGKDQPESPARPIKSAEQLPEKSGADEQAQLTGDPLADLSSFELDEELSADDAPKIVKAFAAVTVKLRDVTAELRGLKTWRDATEQQSQQQAAAEIHRRALTSLHSLGNTELFGKPDEKPTKEQAANVEKAIDAHFTHARGLFLTGRTAAPTPEFLKAAVHLAFGDQLSKIQQRQLTDKLRKQAARRTGGGGGGKPLPKPPSPDESPRERAQRHLTEGGLQARYDELASK